MFHLTETRAPNQYKDRLFQVRESQYKYKTWEPKLLRRRLYFETHPHPGPVFISVASNVLGNMHRLF